MYLPPDWVLKLKPGEYEMEQLMKITGKHRSTISQVLIKLGVKIKKVPSGYRNLNKNIFIWEGYKIDHGNLRVNHGKKSH